MNLYNQLSEQEIKSFEKWVDTVSLQNSGKREASAEKILSIWSNEKKNLYKLLGNNLKINKDFYFEKSIKDIEQDISLALEEDPFNFKNMFIETVYKNFDRSLADKLMLLISPEILALNRWPYEETLTLLLPSGKFYKIFKDQKIIRTLEKLNKEFNIVSNFLEFKIKHSQCLNDKKIYGKLHLSIHPLDFLTLSDNDYNWSTCMQQRIYRYYHNSNIPLMNSSYIIVAYLTGSKDDMSINNEFFYPNKKWRELFIVNEYSISAVKSYPIENKELENLILDWLRQLAKENLNWTYNNNTIWNSDDKETLNGLKIFYTCKYAYNDMRGKRKVMYNPKKILSILPIFNKNNIQKININYTGIETCLICGENKEYYLGKIAVCKDCFDKFYKNNEER